MTDTASSLPLLPGATLGVLGGGQLGRMFAVEALRMGYWVWVLDPDPNSPTGAIATRHFQGNYQDEEILQVFGEGCDAITIEFENIPADAVRFLSKLTRVTPEAECIEIAQDRRKEKQFVLSHGLSTTPFGVIEKDEDVATVCRDIGFPSILKTAQLGYDGKGQAVCQNAEEVEVAFNAVGKVACVLEKRVDLDKELSVVLSRNDVGEITAFPVAENVHVNGILDTSLVPALVSPQENDLAVEIAGSVIAAMNYVGVLAVEMFLDTDGNILINEMAPRPHNSGHYTLNGCAVSQFEQQVRILCGLEPGSTELISPIAMLNLLGDSWIPKDPNWAAVYSDPGASLHLYGKAEARKGRKMGHINVTAKTGEAALSSVETIKKLL